MTDATIGTLETEMNRGFLQILVLALLVWAAPLPVVQASVSPGGAFGSAVPCLTSTDQFAFTRYDNTVFGATSPAS